MLSSLWLSCLDAGMNSEIFVSNSTSISARISMSNDSSSGGGIGFVGLLTIVFVVLKLTHYVAWSWWWVLSPTWIATAFCFVLATIWVLLANFVKK